MMPKLKASRVGNILRQIIPLFKYSIVGFVTTLVDFSIFSLLSVAYEIPGWQANICSYTIGIIFSFTVNRQFTFRQTTLPIQRILSQFARFFIVNVVGLLISSLVIYFLSRSLGPVVAKGVSIPFVLVFGYMMAHRWVFRASPSTSRLAGS
jgi:putative flippase GtrA